MTSLIRILIVYSFLKNGNGIKIIAIQGIGTQLGIEPTA